MGMPPGPAKVEKIEGDVVTISAENRMNPFAGKKMQVGTEGKGGNNQTLRIEKIEGKVVTVKHTNPPNHAFAGVELKVGAEWTNEKNQKFQIKAIEGNRVGYTFTANQFAGKEFTLEVEILSIK
jgi:FKBP-type peptidyl-prolyl cis-trans isomerase 2